MRRAVAAAAAALGLAVAALWGCASSGPAPLATEGSAERATGGAPDLAHDWQHYEPDGGWAAYVPARQSEPHSMEAATAADPQIDVLPVGPSGATRSAFRSY